MLKLAILTTLSLSLLGAATTAHADQCALNTKAINERALDLVKPGAWVLDMCEPCGDTIADAKPYVVKTIDIQQGRVMINGKGVDLAYVFVKTSAKRFDNVGLKSSCGASDVSLSIDDGTPSGRTPQPPAIRPPSHHTPPPRATSVDEYAGTWSARITTRYSSCARPAGGISVVTWSITQNGSGGFALQGSDGTTLAGTPDANQRNIFRLALRRATQPSGFLMNVSMLTKGHFMGTIVRTEKGPSASDPICIIQEDVTATRKP